MKHQENRMELRFVVEDKTSLAIFKQKRQMGSTINEQQSRQIYFLSVISFSDQELNEKAANYNNQLSNFYRGSYIGFAVWG